MERFATRLEQGLEKLRGRLERAAKPVDRAQVERQIGRMLAKNSRAAGKYTIAVEPAPERRSGLRLRVDENPAWMALAKAKEGCYLLRTNVSAWSEQELWQTYIQLTDAEAAFRVQKSELKIRPVWHQREDRVQAHIFVCFLAYALWKTLEQWTRRAGLGSCPRTVLDELAQVQSVDVVLPTKDAQILRVRCVVKPERAAAVLIERLGLELPRRLRVPAPIAAAEV